MPLICTDLVRPIKGYEGKYSITFDGRVISHNYLLKGVSKDISPNIDHDGYLSLKLSLNGKIKRYRVHRLVATAFIDNPLNLPEVNHKDGIKTHNYVENLEWCTFLENRAHAYRVGLYNNKGEGNGQSKLKTHQIKEILQLKDQGIHFREIMKLFNISQTQYYRIINKVSWRHL